MSYAQIERLWIKNGGPPSAAPTMAAIAMAESSRDPGAQQQGVPDSQKGWGLWQITPTCGLPGPYNKYLDPNTNAKAAVHLYKSAGYGTWATHSSGAYQQYMGPANAAFPAAKNTHLASSHHSSAGSGGQHRGGHSGGGHSHPGHAHGGGHSHGGHPGSHGDVKMDPAELGQLGTLLSDGIPSLITGRSAITTALQALGALKDVKELGIPAQVKSLESLGQKAIGDLTPLITGLEGNAQQVAQTKNAVSNADTGTVSPGGQSGLGQTAQQGLTSLAGAGAGAAGANPLSSGGAGPGGATSGGAPIAPAAAGGGAPGSPSQAGNDLGQGASGGDPSQGAGAPGGDPSQSGAGEPSGGGPGGGDPSQSAGGPGGAPGGDPSQGAGAPGAAPPPPPPPGGPGGQPASYTVHHGDNFYKIAEQHLTQGGQHPTHAQITQYWHKLIAANQNTIPHPGNPNLIMPGEVVNLPPM